MAHDVVAEVTGRVWRVVAREGDEVAAGDVVVVLESMKMELPMVAQVAGVVAVVAVEEGEPVDEGSVLARIE